MELDGVRLRFNEALGAAVVVPRDRDDGPHEPEREDGDEGERDEGGGEDRAEERDEDENREDRHADAAGPRGPERDDEGALASYRGRVAALSRTGRTEHLLEMLDFVRDYGLTAMLEWVMEAIEAGLKVYQPKKGKAIINSIMARPERMEALIPLAGKYGAGMVALLWGPEGMPRDTDERAMFLAELYMAATEAGVAPEDIYVDPIITPVNVQQDQLPHCMGLYQAQEDLAPGCRSTNGLSNVSNGAPEHLRPILNQTFLMMLIQCGVQGAIVDAFDQPLQDIGYRQRQILCSPECLDAVQNYQRNADGQNQLADVSKGVDLP